MKNLLIVFIGGGFGSVIRYLIGVMINNVSKIQFPISTFLANVIASGILALVITQVQIKNFNEDHRLLMAIGICGGLSTFSTFTYEMFLLISKNEYLLAVIYLIVSNVVCLIVFYWVYSCFQRVI